MKARVVLLLLGLKSAWAVTSADANNDGEVDEAEANQLFKANYLKDYYKYPVPAAATPGREGFYCPNVTVLKDTATGWQGQCDGLVYNKDAASEAECQLACEMKMDCAVWQWSGKPGQPLGPSGETQHCYMGNDAIGCRGASRADLTDMRSQRILHGSYAPVESVIGVQIIGLFHYQISEGMEAEKIERCKDDCYSNTYCSIWQYLRSDEANEGCWLENGPNPKNIESSPPKTGETAKLMIAGERIARTCPKPPAAPEEASWTRVIILCCVLAALAAIGLAVFLRKKPVSKKSRAIKTASVSKTEEVPLMPIFQIQPIQYVAQPQMQPQMMTYAQVPQNVVYEQPMVMEQQPMMYATQPEVMYQQVPQMAPQMAAAGMPVAFPGSAGGSMTVPMAAPTGGSVVM